MDLLAALFYVSIFMLFYIYAGYPLLAKLLGVVTNRAVKPAAETDSYEPTVTVLIAAYNESAHIAETVRNKLEQDYPADKLDVIVVSDESDDETDEEVNRLRDPRVRLIRQVPRAGKTSALNLALPEATGEIIVFSDANSLYGPETVRNLIAPLADPEVGYVTGRMVYKAPDGSLTGEGCSAYMTYENKLREWETRLGSVVGVDGGVDAMRREIYAPMNADQLPDFVQPLTVREKGHRVVYEPRALLYEDALAAAADEYRMRVRVSLRAYHALKDKAALLNPARFGIFAWQLWSHKVLRYLAFVFMIAAFVSNWILSSRTNSAQWAVPFVGQIVFYGLAQYGHLMTRRGLPTSRLIGLAHFLCLVNLASAQAFWQFLRGRKQIIWKPRT
jgi:cellulose synthase/poly-beta-1,6-N-acetylglucosamine synthase-like glycosyltransferase